MEAEEQEEDANSFSKDESETNSRDCLRYMPLGIAFLLLAGAAAATWYFLGKNSICFVPMQELDGVQPRQCRAQNVVLTLGDLYRLTHRGKSLSPTYQQGNPEVSSVGRLQTVAPGTGHPAVLLWQPPGPQSAILPGPWTGGVQSLLVGVS